MENHHDHDAQTQSHAPKQSFGFQKLATCRTNYPFKAKIVLAFDFGMMLRSGAHAAVHIHALYARDHTTQPLI